MALSGSVFAAFIVALAISAIVLRRPRHEDRDRVAERAGKEIDRMVEKAEQQIDMASRKIQRAAKDARK
ncbi:MAG TPA: hypothetical protein VGK54_15610 [Chloroflexota bacterium]